MAKIQTVHQHIAWSYANLAAAHSALGAGGTSYSRTNYMIRARLYKGLINGSMSMRTLLDDEKTKYHYPDTCCYCGKAERLSMDHLIPKSANGPDNADNIVWACRSCNSSKGGRDVLRWLASKGRKPSILLLRRYLKLIARHCDQEGLLHEALEDVKARELPFDLDALPYKLEPLSAYALWPGTDS